MKPPYSEREAKDLIQGCRNLHELRRIWDVLQEYKGQYMPHTFDSLKHAVNIQILAIALAKGLNNLFDDNDV